MKRTFDEFSAAELQMFRGASKGVWPEIEQALQNGADINARLVNSNLTALRRAIFYKHWVVAYKLVKSPGIDVTEKDSNDDETLLSHVFKRISSSSGQGVMLLVHELVKAGVDPHKHNMLAIAAKRDLFVFVEYFLQWDEIGRFARFDKSEVTAALVAACDRSDDKEISSKMVSLLLKHGGDARALDKNGDPLLHRAVLPNQCFGGADEVLIQAGVDVNRANETTGQTALHYVAMFWNEKQNPEWAEDVTDMLLRMNASLTTKDMNGKTPVEIARENKSWAVLARMLKESDGVYIL